MKKKYEFPGVDGPEKESEGIVTDEKGGVETKKEWEEELQERNDDPTRWREQK